MRSNRHARRVRLFTVVRILFGLFFLSALTLLCVSPAATRGSASDSGTTPTPAPSNSAPVGVYDLYLNVNPDPFSPTVIPSSEGVLRNDSDPDGDPLTAELAWEAQWGRVSLMSNGGFVYFPPPNIGTDVFYYYVSDGTNRSGPVKVLIDLGERNRPPVAANDYYSVTGGNAFNGNAFANDRDADGDMLSAHLLSYPAHGGLSFADSGGQSFIKFGAFTYTSAQNFVGTDNFTYVLCDLEYCATVTTVFITVEPAAQPTPTPDRPTLVFSSPAYEVTEGCVPAFITVNLLTPAGTQAGPVSVDYAIEDGTASQKNDYTYAAGTLSFSPGEKSKAITVLVNDDGYVEGTENLKVELSNPAGAALGEPATATLNVSDNDSAEYASIKPIDYPRDFVCQHYHDFLHRQPDAEGQAFWEHQIVNCRGDSACIAAKRVQVSAAFFFSIEFQQTGYFAERLYEACLGRRPSYEEFVRDVARIGAGVEVGVNDWAERLEQNKRAFSEEFVAREEFKVKYPERMAAGEYVDEMFEYAGVEPSAAERQAAFDVYGAGGVQGRAAAMRAVVESASVFRAYYNRGFVLTEYFGYLRRDPPDPPDQDWTGYDFWLTKMNAFSLPGEDVVREADAFARVRRAEMVRAFIESSEYRQRFGK